VEDLECAAQWQLGTPLPKRVALDYLRQISLSRRKNLLRFWIKKLGLGIVSSVIIGQIEASMVNAKEDAMPLISWQGGELRRYRQHLYAMPPLPSFDASAVLHWQWSKGGLKLPSAQGILNAHISETHAKNDNTRGLSLAQCEKLPMTVRFRRGGERCRLAGRQHSHELKGLLQQAAVPPWLRERIPLIYLGDQLAAVVGYYHCEPFLAQNNEPAVTFTIR